MLERFLSTANATRALCALRKLASHDISQWALTGGFAIEIQRLRLGCKPSVRSLNDIDFITSSFDCIPQTLSDDFLFRHIHPFDPPGKTLLQFIDPDTALRIDVFRAYGATMSRTSRLDLSFSTIQIVSLEDLVARTARLMLDIAHGAPVPSKHAVDLLRLLPMVHCAEVEAAWQVHRRPTHPLTFAEASTSLAALIPAHPKPAIDSHDSKNTEKVCPRCAPTSTFKLVDSKVVMSLLGHC